jgi:hypothetical protein
MAVMAVHDLDDEEVAEYLAALDCLPGVAAGQCSTADAALGDAYFAAMPCDEGGSNMWDNDCPSGPSMACRVCMLKTGELDDLHSVNYLGATASTEALTAAMAICDPDIPKSSGTAGLVVSLALACVSAVVTQL